MAPMMSLDSSCIKAIVGKQDSRGSRKSTVMLDHALNSSLVRRLRYHVTNTKDYEGTLTLATVGTSSAVRKIQ